MSAIKELKPLISADLLSSDPDLVAAYLELRQEDARAFCRSLNWVSKDMYSVKAEVFGHIIVHELKEVWLHSFPVWGELFWDDSARHGDPIIFHTMECYVAYILARYY